MRALTATLCLPLCLLFAGCYLTSKVWSGYGGDYVTNELVAQYTVDAIGRDCSGGSSDGGIVLHATQRGGAVARLLADRCADDTWIQLQPGSGADTALALLADEAAFTMKAVTLVVDHRRVRGLLGEQGTAVLDLAVEIVPAAIGTVRTGDDVAVVDDEVRPDDPALQRTLAECAADLAGTDWSRLDARLTATTGARLLAWITADGVRWSPPPALESPGDLLFDVVAIEAGFATRPWSCQLSSLQGMRAEVECRAVDGRLLVLSLDARRAWTYARALRDGGNGDVLHVSNWRAELSRTMPVEAAPRASAASWQVALHSADQQYVSGPTFGSTMLRVLATPFAVAGDIASALLVAAIDALLDDDGDSDDGH